MKESKVFIKHRNYFKRGELLLFVSVGAIVVSVVLFLFGYSWISYYQFFFVLPAGIALLVFHSVTTAGEGDLDRYLTDRTQDLCAEWFEKNGRQKELLGTPAPVYTDGYEYREGALLRRDRKSHLRSTWYTKAILYPTEEALGIVSRTVSLVSEEIESLDMQIPYTEIRNIALVREKKRIAVGKKSVPTTAERLVIEYGELETLAVPMRDSVDTDTWIEKVRGLIEKAKK